MCPTPVNAAAAALAAAAIQRPPNNDKKTPPAPASSTRLPSTERANAEEPAKLSALGGTPAIIDALNAQTRARARRELEERGMGKEHPDYMCFELVRQGAPGKLSQPVGQW
jgi:hypothetical protein